MSRLDEYYAGATYSAAFVANHSWNGREANRAYLNLGEHPFWDVSLALGLDSIFDGRGFVAFDFDHDGDQDILVSNSAAPAQLFVNHWADELDHHWLKVDLRGVGGGVAIGATVRVHVGDRVEAQAVVSNDSYASSRSGPLHFGLGAATGADRIEVSWPGGGELTVEGIAADQLVRIDSDGSVELLPWGGR